MSRMLDLTGSRIGKQDEVKSDKIENIKKNYLARVARFWEMDK